MASTLHEAEHELRVRLDRTLRQEAALFRLASADGQTFTQRLHTILRLDADTLDVGRVSYWSMRGPPEMILCEALYLSKDARVESGLVLAEKEHPRYFAALRTGEPIAAADAHEDLRTSEFSTDYLGPLGIGAMLDVPVYVQGRLAGVVCHEHVGGPRVWAGDEQLFAMTMAQAVSLAIETEERERAEHALRESERRFRAIVECSPVPTLVISFPEGVCRYGNAAASEMSGVPLDDMQGKRAIDFYADPAERGRVLAELRARGSIKNREIRLRRADGAVYWAILSIERIVFDERPSLVVSFWDISRQKELEERLRTLALHDALTRLPNRVLLFDLLRGVLARVRRGADPRFGVLFVDLDDFKRVNDAFGHDAGDALLRQVAERLKEAVRASDIPARIGGDEFAVLLPDVADAAEARAVGERVAEELKRPYRLPQGEATISASVGVLLADGTYEDADALVRDADRAMYRAKQEGKARVAVFIREGSTPAETP